MGGAFYFIVDFGVSVCARVFQRPSADDAPRIHFASQANTVHIRIETGSQRNELLRIVFDLV